MTTPIAPKPVPTNPRLLASDGRFTDGEWRAEDGRNLYQVLLDQLGGDAKNARRLWSDAASLVDESMRDLFEGAS